MPKVLITGAGGQVGYKLTALAGKSGFSVFAAGHADLDITDRSQVNSAVARELPDVIINVCIVKPPYAEANNSEIEQPYTAAIFGNISVFGLLSPVSHIETAD